jgi:hypothetical protein
MSFYLTGGVDAGLGIVAGASYSVPRHRCDSQRVFNSDRSSEKGPAGRTWRVAYQLLTRPLARRDWWSSTVSCAVGFAIRVAHLRVAGRSSIGRASSREASDPNVQRVSGTAKGTTAQGPVTVRYCRALCLQGASGECGEVISRY